MWTEQNILESYTDEGFDWELYEYLCNIYGEEEDYDE